MPRGGPSCAPPRQYAAPSCTTSAANLGCDATGNDQPACAFANPSALVGQVEHRLRHVAADDSCVWKRFGQRACRLSRAGAEVEDALCLHPKISEAAVVGSPSEEWGEQVVAYAVVTAPVELQEIRDFLADQLAPYKSPRALHCVDSLPRNALGKVQKHRLQNGRVQAERSD